MPTESIELKRKLSPLQGLTSIAVICVIGFQVLSAFMVSYWWKHGPKAPIEAAALPSQGISVFPSGSAGRPPEPPLEVAKTPDSTKPPGAATKLAANGEASKTGTTAVKPAPPPVVADVQVQQPKVASRPEVPQLPKPSLDWIKKAEAEERRSALANADKAPIEQRRPERLPPIAKNPVNTKPALRIPATLDTASISPPVPNTSPEVSQWMKLATQSAADGDLDEAERLLIRVQQVAPMYQDAYRVRAGLLERLEDFAGAKDQWQRAASVAKENPGMRANAMRQASRLERKIQQVVGMERARQKLEESRNQLEEIPTTSPKVTPPPSTAELASAKRNRENAAPKLPDASRLPPSLRIRPEVGSVISSKREPDSANDNIREISLWMLADRRYGLVDLNRIGIKYCFFDRDVSYPDEVHLSHARPIQHLDMQIDHSDANYYRVKLTLKYLIPKGTRAYELRQEKSRKLEYFGFLIKVFYDGEEQTNDFPVVRPTRVNHEIFAEEFWKTVPAANR